jgi:hypothetical protein
MSKLKKRIYQAIDRLAHKAAIKFDKMSKWAYWKLLNIEKKENTDRIISHMDKYDSIEAAAEADQEIYDEYIDWSEHVAELFDVPPVMLNLMQGNNHKPKEKKNASQA